MTQQHYSLKEVAKIVGVKAHRISYAVSNGYIAEPAERITNRRMFTEADLQAAKKYFATHPKMGRPARKEGDR
jgi:DNA-binding transcriptional MerR regulator